MTWDNKHYRLIVENLPHGFAYHKVIFDGDNNPVDYVFLEVNNAFAAMFGFLRRGEYIWRGKK